MSNDDGRALSYLIAGFGLGTMVGTVASKGPAAFEFSLPGAAADVPPLVFKRQP